ncbi:MAG: hypothetical protein K2F69_04895 [Bacteroidaceae bacterium]|nr:hypothetical protein [Bacteroidaceae bacterium]
MLINNCVHDFSLVENKIQKFPLKEKDEIMQGLLIAKLTQDAIQESFLMTRGLSLKSFACNLATGGIATVWGEMAAGVAIFCGASAVVTGGASVVVSLVGGSLLSSVAC